MKEVSVMCKGKQRQKNEPIQTDLFIRLEKPDDSERDGSPDRDDAGLNGKRNKVIK
jgi:hypothetical protein